MNAQTIVILKEALQLIANRTPMGDSDIIQIIANDCDRMREKIRELISKLED